MAETTKIEGDSGSNANVAYKLLQMLAGYQRIDNGQQLLDAYVDCLQATYGNRPSKAGR